jgi:hypothetical protein
MKNDECTIYIMKGEKCINEFRKDRTGWSLTITTGRVFPCNLRTDGFPFTSCLSIRNSKEFAISGEGSGFDVGCLFSEFCHDGSVTGSNVMNKLKELIANYLKQARIYANPNLYAGACIISRKEGVTTPFESYIEGSTYQIRPIPAFHRCIGVEAAKILGDYFLKGESWMSYSGKKQRIMRWRL